MCIRDRLKGFDKSTKEYWLNVVCWGSQFQQVFRIGGDERKTAENVWQSFVAAWIRFMGHPEVLVCDPGLEFQGYFAEMAAANGMVQLVTDARAPWQNGRTERAGAEWKRQLKLARRKEEPTSAEEWEALGLECSATRNRYHNRSGFSPMQRVFGFTHRLPNSLVSDDVIDPNYLSEHPMDDFVKAQQLRQAAQKAWAAIDSRSKILKVLRARHRPPENFQRDQTVYVWRQPRVGTGRWHGPGIIVLPTAGGAWVNMRGSVWRVANEQMRSASSEEQMGAELVNKFLTGMREELPKLRGARKFVDVERTGGYSPVSGGISTNQHHSP